MRQSTATSAARAPFLDELRETWLAAARAGGSTSRSYDVAGASLVLHVAGSALVSDLTRALAHLPRGAPGDRSLTVYAWDGESTGASPRLPAWSRLASPGEAIRVIATDGVSSAGEGRLESLSLPRGEALFWVDGPARIAWHERAQPLLAIVRPWTASRDVQMVHAAAVGRRNGCLLIVGRSGTGKSTTALACLESPLRLVADDFCLVRAGDLRVFGLYGTAKATDDTLERLPALVPLVTNPQREPGEKATVFLHERAPDVLLSDAPLRGIVVPRIMGRRTSRIVPAGRSAALAELAPGSVFEHREARAGAFRRLAAAAGAVPCHVLELGSDLREVPPLLESLLDG